MAETVSRRRLRCAIYTRKSSEEGLEQDFNSLDAQREACASYIASQKREGWVGLRAYYDDGGYSGGTMDRPGLRSLLADSAARKVDVVVVYKVDRLTRALADFAKHALGLDPGDRRCVRQAWRLIRICDTGVQHHDLDGAADAQRAALIRPVRARG